MRKPVSGVLISVETQILSLQTSPLTPGMWANSQEPVSSMKSPCPCLSVLSCHWVVNKWVSCLAHSLPIATKVWNKILWPAHRSVLLQVSGSHGYSIIMDASERQWQIGWWNVVDCLLPLWLGSLLMVNKLLPCTMEKRKGWCSL